MGDLTGTWNIFSHRVGVAAVFKEPTTTVAIDTADKTAGFELLSKEPVGLVKTQTHHSGTSNSYTYRVEHEVKNGFRMLFGNVSDKTHAKEPNRCGFIGLECPQVNAVISSHVLPILMVPFYHTGKHPHYKGNKLAINVPGKQLTWTTPNGNSLSFDEVSFTPHPKGGISMFAKKKTGDYKLAGWILACSYQQKLRLVLVGHQWNYTAGQFGGPTNPECARNIVIDPWADPVYV